jgi:hypothetical protein
VLSRVKGWKGVIKVVGKSSMFSHSLLHGYKLIGRVNNGDLNMAGTFEMPSMREPSLVEK